MTKIICKFCHNTGTTRCAMCPRAAAVERVNIGHETVTQSLVPGVAPITQDERDRQTLTTRLQGRIGRPAVQNTNPGGMFDTAARNQQDLF